MILASNNKGKLREIKEILGDVELKTLRDVNIDIEVEEDQDTFYGNALKKAKEIYELTNEATISDDSGLCINELNDWPGVLTHRFLGEGKTDRERNLAIIEKVQSLPKDKRIAKVVCNIVYYNDGEIIVGEGIIKGYISDSPRGENGFGFDEIFVLANGKTLAELTPEEKNNVSARALALQDLKQKLESNGYINRDDRGIPLRRNLRNN